MPLHDPQRRSFFSDNLSGVHPEVLEAIVTADGGAVDSYGDDPYTARLQDVMAAHFGAGTEAFPVLNGTGANVLSLRAATPRWGAVITPESSHTVTEEAGAPEQAGVKLITVAAPDGKLHPDQIHEAAQALGIHHLAQPSAVSIADATETGTVYTPDEVVSLTGAAHEHGMAVHVDGSRLAVAAAHLGTGLSELTSDAGVDIISLGATKNGAMVAEAVIVPPGPRAAELAQGVRMLRKSTLQLVSKMRFISAQLIAMYEGDLWLRNASASNEMAERLAEQIGGLPGVRIAHRVQSNAVFVVLPEGAAESLRAGFGFHGEGTPDSPARLMCGFDTAADDVDALADAIRRVCEDPVSAGTESHLVG
ncbi:MAG: beta-eliminating lyase-related protein [Acidipropionibacterium acidipropionici]|jgi:threonine aldolase|nr:beta-eliminating lyase-related protein [Acidipropionibacterium acidipropionici]ALN16022.1 threonine aldolase [Acidipropionibacterium acidipropionici]AMS04526.1 threonine aldolase [Acidipropionibacterium acidipropionici]AOZ46019.1 threonine aldolase [Acidipropionibacterium acidipropionici]APZ08227.1 threonine aldolase [Acidipropionibacterium acidipropionici]AZP37958.1 threonine aldolase [Acidipropionibacterium acidipropionici]